MVQRIVDEANGVFLWVSLATQTLLQGLTNVDRICDMEERLKNIPKTLEAYFRHMFDSVDEHYKSLAAIQIQTSLEALEPLDVMTLWYLDEVQPQKPNIDRKRMNSMPTSTDPSYIEDAISRRLQARCKGLLEMTLTAPKDQSKANVVERLLTTKANFLH